MKNFKRLYIMPEVWVTVTQSQIFNWISIVNKNGISTDCLSITKKKHSKRDVKEIENSLGGRFIEIHNNKRLIVNDLYLTLNLIKYYFTHIFKYKKIVFQTRLIDAAFAFSILKWLPRARFVFESRAAVNEELIHTNKGGMIGNIKYKIKKYVSEKNEESIIKKSDAVFCVSNALKKYYIEKYNLTREERFSIFPGAADAGIFFYSKSLRNNIRKELGLGLENILIVYSGRLEMKWEIPEAIISFFNSLFAKNYRFRLLLLTPDIGLANELIEDNRLEDIVFVKKVKLEEVNNYLNASDLGLLLREDIPMNNVASPTKFAEYLMSGLPVIISSSIHDFADIITKTGFGVVSRNTDKISAKEYKELLESLKFNKEEIEKWGQIKLSKESFIEEYLKILSEI